MPSIVTAIKQAYISTFITDDRYLIFLEGFKNTLILTIGAGFVGMLVGILVAVAKVYYYQDGPYKFWESIGLFIRTKHAEHLGHAFQKLLDMFLSLYLTVFRGTPVVVQLMIWAFVILSTTNELLVAIIGFGINSGAYVAEIVRAGIMAVDKGQTEAGRSLGLSAWATMRKIVLPQAIKNVLPAFGNEFISLLKETSIVGYIAIVDITKAAALVRARTFDAFVPLLFVAAVYLTLVIFISMAQKKIESIMRKSERK